MAKLTDFFGQPHTGTVPWAVVGIVTDNVDPDRMGRIKVSFPTLCEHEADNPLSFWIRQATPNGGIKRGFYALPEVEDEVLVAFMSGSQDVGVIIGQFWNGVDLPPEEAEGGMPGSGKTDTGGKFSTDKFSDGSSSIDDNDRRLWRSRSGHLFVFDDTGGSETVQIWDQTHTLAFVFDSASSAIYLTNSSGDIHIRTKNDLYLDAGNDIKWVAGNNIVGESGQDTKHKAGMNWKMEAGTNAEGKAGANMKLEATANVDIKAGAMGTYKATNLTLEGSAMATLKAGAMTKVTGGMVMIN